LLLKLRLVDDSWKRVLALFYEVFIVTLRGISQVVLLNDPITGALIAVGVFIGGGAWLGFTAFSCTLISTVVALNAFKDTESVSNGIAGYNAYLVGCAFAVFVCPDWDGGTLFAALFFAVGAAVLNLSLQTAFGPNLTRSGYLMTASVCYFVI
jgi:urea transporter